MPAVIAPAVIVRSLMCHLHCAILIVPSSLRRRYMSWVGIAFGRRVRRCARYHCHITTILSTLWQGHRIVWRANAVLLSALLQPLRTCYY
jgi:hypothetical protein